MLPSRHRAGIMGPAGTTSRYHPPPVPGGGSAWCVVVVADSLDDLRGPLQDEVRPFSLVLLKAATAGDVVTWLDSDALVRDWLNCTCR